MSISRKIAALAAVDAAYIAGLVDGEGTATLTRRHRADERQLVVSISSTERDLLEHVKRVAGAGRITSKRTYRTEHTPSFTFAICNRQALDLLAGIAPYMRGYKRERARLVLDKYVALTPRNGRYTDRARQEREAFIQRFFSVTARTS
ncbi:MAG TPA: LAGLIDADG family homing endonuclease [Burkholderiales bacterium]|nr:LAGLIDADG family homing endonuclease [Burkholderiales bacterium]